MAHNTLTAQMFDALASADIDGVDISQDHAGRWLDLELTTGDGGDLLIDRDRRYPDGLGWRTRCDRVGTRHHRTMGDVVDYVTWWADRYGYTTPDVAPVTLILFDGASSVAV
ncbi:hypothetical protein SEA_KIDNEYBEAN_90 [Gordonia phage KidneyBean]|uniref:Uncharacterized protein n=1 Tax=Gordonia phage KidneyBean TaxID=2301603 RepID=A0A385UK68_9CAUD|nr:hypothetical protein KNU11_gp90 [Gordonia phage KidneyBean]AYB69807.1 hypothetical protein SEA_KIDNEYBEAN_90 [Gordonia phage KidneyBean]QZD98933.1 hypothetical protein SEA_TRACKER_90 [Gordonia phage Tracker]